MLIPEKLINFRCYAGLGVEFLGTTDVELPKFDPMTEKVSGAGIAGEFDSPVVGHFQSQVIKLKWRTPTARALGLLAPVDHLIQLYGAIQVRDSEAGRIVTQQVLLQVSGPMKSFGLGNFEVGKPTAAESEIECAKLDLKIDGVPLVELDKFNSVFKVAGVDYLRDVRIAMGGV